jgi:hypothetical protein
MAQWKAVNQVRRCCDFFRKIPAPAMVDCHYFLRGKIMLSIASSLYAVPALGFPWTKVSTKEATVLIQSIPQLRQSKRQARTGMSDQPRCFLKAWATLSPLRTSSLILSSAATSFGINAMTSSSMSPGMATTPSSGSQKMISPCSRVKTYTAQNLDVTHW